MQMKNGKLLIDLLKQEDVSKDGVIYTESQRHKSFKGAVAATDDKSGYELGDVVVFSEFAGENIHIDGKEHLIIDSEDVWGVMEVSDVS